MGQLKMLCKYNPEIMAGLDREGCIKMLPEGYFLRTYESQEDADAWIKTCADGLDTGNMTSEDFRKSMLERTGILPEGIFLLCDVENNVVGTATGIIQPDGWTGYLHMVAVMPSHRGKKLSKLLNAVVLNYLHENGRDYITLDTDDFRIPAIKTYINLGFFPILYEEGQKERWLKIMKEINVPKFSYYEFQGYIQPYPDIAGSLEI